MQTNSPHDPDGPASDASVRYIDPYNISPDMLAALGVGQVAYVRAATLPTGLPGIAIHAANGSVLGYAQTEAVARASALQNDLEAVSVH